MRSPSFTAADKRARNDDVAAGREDSHSLGGIDERRRLFGTEMYLGVLVCPSRCTT